MQNAARATPTRRSEPPLRLDLSAGSFRGPGGVVWRLVQQRLDAKEARALVRAGALVASDDCGCGGACGLRWLSVEARARLARSRPDVPASKRFDGVTAWRDDSGHDLVIVGHPIHWDGIDGVPSNE